MNDDSLDQTPSDKEPICGYRMGEWTLSIHANRLTKDAGAVDLEYRQTRILVYLMERANQIISKDELIKTIWEKKVVNEESLPVAISQIRKALNDDARTPRFIKTIPGVGYQFIADVLPLRIVQKNSASPNPKRTFYKPMLVILALAIILSAWILGRQSVAVKIEKEIQPTTSASGCDSKWFSTHSKTETEMREQVQGLRHCVEQDPNHAQAFLKLAETKMWLYGETVVQTEKTAEVKALLQHSLTLNPSLAYAHLWLAYLASQDNAENHTAETHFRKALDLAPNDAIIHMHYAHFLFVHQRFEEARAHLDAKRDLNPLTYSQMDLVWLYILQGDNKKAEQELERISATEIQGVDFHTAAENVYLRIGKEQKAFEQMRWFFTAAKFAPEKIQTIEIIYSQQGIKGVFAWLYDTQEKAELGQFSPPLSFARYAMLAGKSDQAKIHLKEAYEQRNLHSQCTIADPFFSSLIKQKDVQQWIFRAHLALE